MMVVLLSAVSVNAHAAVFETGGEFRVRGWWLDNYMTAGAATEYWDQRLRLSVNWPLAEHVRVQVRPFGGVAAFTTRFWPRRETPMFPSKMFSPRGARRLVERAQS